MKFPLVNQFNYASDGNSVAEKDFGPSLTVPGMALSLQEMLKRYVRGENVTTFEPVYTDAEIPDNLERMTEIEKLELLNEIRGEVGDLIEIVKGKKKVPVDPSDEGKKKVPVDPSDDGDDDKDKEV